MYSVTRATIQSVCRICLKNIDNENKSTCKVQDVKEWLFECTGRHYDDHHLLPKKVCVSCCTTLQSIKQFQQLAYQTYEYLKNLCIEWTENRNQGGTRHNAVNIPYQNEVENEVYESFIVDEFLEEPSNDVSTSHTYSQDDVESNELVMTIETEDYNCVKREPISDDEEEELVAASRRYQQNKQLSTKRMDNTRNTASVSLQSTPDSSRDMLQDYDSDENADDTLFDIGLPSADMFQCTVCSASFSRKCNLRRHMKVIHNDMSCKKAIETHKILYPFSCEVCGRPFRKESQYKFHMRIHNADPRLLCTVCKCIKRTIKEIEEHKMKYHNNKCMQCYKIFNSAAHLREHFNSVHLKLRPFKCDICSKGFARAYDCEKHALSHSNDRTLVCDICNRRFGNRTQLQKHKSAHLIVDEIEQEVSILG